MKIIPLVLLPARPIKWKMSGYIININNLYIIIPDIKNDKISQGIWNQYLSSLRNLTYQGIPYELIRSSTKERWSRMWCAPLGKVNIYKSVLQWKPQHSKRKHEPKDCALIYNHPLTPKSTYLGSILLGSILD